MKRGLKSFARAARDGRAADAREWLEKISQGHMDDGLWEGYELALEGIAAALEDGEDLTLPHQIASGKCSKEQLSGFRERMEARAEQEFRPADERGFEMAWRDVLTIILEDD